MQLINATISFYETTKASDAVAALKASLKPKATCKRDGKWSDINATDLVPGELSLEVAVGVDQYLIIFVKGDMVLLAAGSAVPADCHVNPPPPGQKEPVVIEVIFRVQRGG